MITKNQLPDGTDFLSRRIICNVVANEASDRFPHSRRREYRQQYPYASLADKTVTRTVLFYRSCLPEFNSLYSNAKNPLPDGANFLSRRIICNVVANEASDRFPHSRRREYRQQYPYASLADKTVTRTVLFYRSCLSEFNSLYSNA